MTSLQIVLATHQGARFLPTLLGSLFAQSETGFTLLVADDASTDGTQAILADYASRYPGQFKILNFTAPAGGALANFIRLTDHVDADYAMFCDQDDLWLPNKVADSLAAMRAAERRLSAGTPILVHTDMALVDADLQPLEPSFWRAMRIDPTRARLRQILVENSLAGCTLLVNRSLYQLARPIPAQATMHDHWLGLVAAGFGHIEYLSASTLLYRRHGGNSSAQARWNAGFILHRAVAALFGPEARGVDEKFAALTRQAAVFRERYGIMLSADRRAETEAVAGLLSKSRAVRCFLLLRYGLLKTDWRRNLYMLLTISRRYPRSGTPSA